MSSVEIKNIISLKEIFDSMEYKLYCIIKLPDNFPDYGIGTDLDIFCYDIQDISEHILSHLHQYITNVITIQIHDHKKQIYIDVIENEKIHFRFDLYAELPAYKNIQIKDAFFSSVIENSSIKNIGGLKIKVPCEIDEAILRYIEYHEWYSQRPDKIKHIEYVMDKIENKKIDLNKILGKLHYYTELPRVKESRQVSKYGFIRYLKYLINAYKTAQKMMREKGINATFTAIKNKVFK